MGNFIRKSINKFIKNNRIIHFIKYYNDKLPNIYFNNMNYLKYVVNSI